MQKIYELRQSKERHPACRQNATADKKTTLRYQNPRSNPCLRQKQG